MVNFFKLIISAIQIYINKLLKNSTADWNQSDKNESNYIKNRTHWSNLEEKLVLKKTTLNFSNCRPVDWGETKTGYIYESIPISLKVNQEYKITFDGKSYSCIAFLDKKYDNVVIGNGAFVGDSNEDTGLPFAIGNYYSGDNTAYVIVADQNIYDISILSIKEEVHKIDVKYLPDDIGIQSDWEETNQQSKAFIRNKPNIENLRSEINSISNSKIDKINPVGTGSFSLNRDASRPTGEYSFAEGLSCEASGKCSHSEGENTMAVGYASHAEGIQTRANQKCCHAEGSYSEAIGEYSHAEGNRTEAWGNSSHAEGSYSKARGNISHSEGSYSEAIGYASHAEGMHTVAFGDYSHTEGAYTKALSRSTNTIGEYNIPDSIYYKEKGISGLYDRVSISMSNNSDIYCSKEYSFDIETGLYTLISPSKVSSNDLRYKQDYYFISNTEKKFERNTISGKILLQVTKNIEAIQNFNNWNFNHVYYEQGESDGSKKGNYVHIVGNGESESTRSNAHTIDWNGNAWFAGDVYIGGTSQSDGSKLITETEVDEKISKINIPEQDLSNYALKSEIPSIAGLATEAYADSAAAQVKNDLLNGAGAAYDTLKELGDLIDVNVDAIEALETVASGKADKVHTHDQYLTEHQDISGKADKSELFSKSYNDLTNKPEIPSIEGLATETYVNNGLANKVDKIEGKSLINIGEIARLSKVDNYDDTEVRDLIDGLSESKANVANIPTKVSQLTNDSGFLTAVPATYATQAFVTDAINKAQLDNSDSEIDLSAYALTSDLALKADKTELHTHENKMLLNTITAENISAINELTSTLNGPRNYYNAEAITDGVYLNSNGRLYENPIYFTTDYIPIAPGQTLYFYGANGRYDMQSNARFVGFFDTGRNFIEGSVASLVNQITNTYENGAYIRITVQHGGWGLGYVENVYPGVDIKYGEIPESGLWEKPQKIDVFLPDDIYCAVGTTIELYNNQVCLQADKLHINWSCDYGHAMKRKFSFEGTSTLAGQIIPLTLEIYNDYNVLKYTQTTQIHVVAATITNPITCVPIGDSWTNQKPWPGEVINLSGEKISFVGKFNTTVKDANGNWREYNHEGRSGFSAYNYDGAFAYTFGNAGEDTYHAFYNPTTARFDWNNYVNTVLGGTQPGAVILQMGINGIAADNTGMVGHEVNMINLIRQDNADIPIFVTLPAYKGNQDGLGVQESSDGHAYHRGVYDYLEKQKVMNYCSLLYEACKDMVGVYFIPLNICFDSEYNYGAQEVPVNPRATSIIEKIPMEAVHPQDYGYYQMADIVYSVMCGNLS